MTEQGPWRLEDSSAGRAAALAASPGLSQARRAPQAAGQQRSRRAGAAAEPQGRGEKSEMGRFFICPGVLVQRMLKYLGQARGISWHCTAQ